MCTCSHEQATTLLGKGGRGKRFHTLEQDQHTNSAAKHGAEGGSDVELALQPEAGAGHMQDAQVGCRRGWCEAACKPPQKGAHCESRACSGTVNLDLSKLLWHNALLSSASTRQVRLALPLTRSFSLS